MGYARFSFRSFESYLRIVAGLDADDIILISKQYKLYFATYKITPGIYTIKDISEAISLMGDHEGTLKSKMITVSWKQTVFQNVLVENLQG